MKAAHQRLACWAHTAESSQWANFPASRNFVSVLQVCSSVRWLFARELSCWVGLLSSQQLQKGESTPSCHPFTLPPPFPRLHQDNGFSNRSPLLASRPLSQLSHWDIFPHFQDYDHFNLDLCVLPPHTKKHLGTGLVGLEEIHICPVQAIGIQSFTLSNATRREKRSWELALPFSTFMKRTVLSFSFSLKFFLLSL